MKFKVIRIQNDNLMIRDTKLICLRYLYNLCCLLGKKSKLEIDEIELTESCNRTFNVNFIDRHTLMYAAEAIETRIKCTDREIDAFYVHDILISSKHIISEAYFNEIIQDVYEDYTLRAKVEREIW
jgi:hypothetical protein